MNRKTKKQQIKRYKNGLKLKKTRKTKKLKKNKGGTTIYDLNTGKITKSNNLINMIRGKSYFRKVFSKDMDGFSEKTKVAEITIAKILMKNPNPHIVNFYNITDNYIDMEELENIYDELDDSQKKNQIIEDMKKAKIFLQGLGIMYVDWKWDNIGKSKIDGKYKLFDFDCSGLSDNKTNSWIIEPVEAWSYRTAKKEGNKTPQEIDDWSFNYNLELYDSRKVSI